MTRKKKAPAIAAPRKGRAVMIAAPLGGAVKIAAPRTGRAVTIDVDTKRDAQLLALVEQQPDDADAILVYADWLEENGDLPRASFLRLQQLLRAMKVSHPKLLARGRALSDLGKTLPPKWIASVTYPKITGTAWDGRDDDGALVLRFLENGFVNYTQPSGTYENGRWEQVGITVAMETNAHYADYFGVIIGDVMRGNAQNIVEHEWRWKVTRTSDPEVAPVPDSVNRTIHDDHVNARKRQPKAAKPKPTAKAKAKPKALPRKTPLQRKTKLKASKGIIRRKKR
ncbi:MAG: TIGR02996 domain-containing protein [Myxococcota bacterium]|nr:TIGR02996 domain-containing protein [Myxococcota bacterium]